MNAYFPLVVGEPVVEYVTGYMFDINDPDRILMVKKNRPDWQAGKHNGIGGKIELCETPIDAMIREFQEETGLVTVDWQWRQFAAHMYQGGHYVHFFMTWVWAPEEPQQMTDEFVHWVNWRTVPCVMNTGWLVPQAQQMHEADMNGYDIFFEVFPQLKK